MSTLVTNCDIINCDSYGLYMPGIILLSYGEKKRVICGMLVETGVI